MIYKKFEDIKIWQEARVLTNEIFKVTSIPPFKTDFRFKDQIRASSASIMDNIAEGFERGGNKEFVQFLFIAKGSCGEARSQLIRAKDFDYIDSEKFEKLYAITVSISNQINGFIAYLKSAENKGFKFH